MKKYSINFVIQYSPDVAVYGAMNSTFKDKKKRKPGEIIRVSMCIEN